MADQVLWARLKPLNEKKGIKLRKFSIYGMRFEESRGWYIVPSTIELANGKIVDIGEVLRSKRNDNEDPDSPLAFDVMSEAEAKNLDESQRREAEERKAAMDANRLRPAVDLLPADYEGTNDDQPATKRRPGRPRKSPPPGV